MRSRMEVERNPMLKAAMPQHDLEVSGISLRAFSP
jgi:hypothetical protein